MGSVSKRTAFASSDNPLTYAATHRLDDAENMTGVGQTQHQDPPFVLPLVGSVVIVVLLGGLWCLWRWYDQQAQAGEQAGEESGAEAEVWVEMRRAGFALGVFQGPNVVGRVGDTWEREQRGRVEPWQRTGRMNGHEEDERRGNAGRTSSRSRSRSTRRPVGPPPKLWEVDGIDDVGKVGSIVRCSFL